MFYVYKYTDISDNITKYVGKVTEQELSKRIRQHSYEVNFQNIDWQIEYIICKTRTQADAYESHFIAKYKTYKYLNKAKSNWGTMPELDNKHFRWMSFYEVEYFDKKNLYGSIVILSECIRDCLEKNCIIYCYLSRRMFGDETLDTYLSMISLYMSARDKYIGENDSEPDFDTYLFNNEHIVTQYTHCSGLDECYEILSKNSNGMLLLCCSENSESFLTNINEQFYNYHLPHRVMIFE